MTSAMVVEGQGVVIIISGEDDGDGSILMLRRQDGVAGDNSSKTAPKIMAGRGEDKCWWHHRHRFNVRLSALARIGLGLFPQQSLPPCEGRDTLCGCLAKMFYAG